MARPLSEGRYHLQFRLTIVATPRATCNLTLQLFHKFVMCLLRAVPGPGPTLS